MTLSHFRKVLKATSTLTAPAVIILSKFCVNQTCAFSWQFFSALPSVADDRDNRVAVGSSSSGGSDRRSYSNNDSYAYDDYNYDTSDGDGRDDYYDDDAVRWPESGAEEEEEVEVLRANPQFVTEPLSLRVELGHTVRLPCEVDSLGK